MARAALNWSLTDLATAANVGHNTVNRYERGNDVRLSTVDKMRHALEAAGIQFIPANGGGEGVRMREKD